MQKQWALAVLFGLSACAPSYTPQQKALYELMANRAMYCNAGADCDEKWNRAIAWVSRHTKTGMRTVTDNLIATNMMTSGDKPPMSAQEFTVVRYAENGREVITFASYCESGFVCGRNTLKFRATFTNAVMGLPPGVTQTGPDAYRVRAELLGEAGR